MIETQYGKYTYNSPSFIRRTTHRLRLKKSIQAAALKKFENILDFGAGDGYLGKSIYEKGFKNISCYEPVDEQFSQMEQLIENQNSITITKTLEELKEKKFDKIFCLEVLEHLPDDSIRSLLKTLHELLSIKGRILISVPWESGIKGFIKNCIKKTVDKNKTFSYRDLWEIAYNKKKVNRKIIDFDSCPYIVEHFGFNNYHLEKLLIENNFIIEKKTNFPTRIFSSQIFYLIKVNKK